MGHKFMISSVRALCIMLNLCVAEELTRQREQLERTDRRLDHISDTLKYSQKQINGIKSVFSSVKNYFSSRKDDSLPETNEFKNTDDTSTVTEKEPNEPIALSKSAVQNLPTIKNDNYNRSEVRFYLLINLLITLIHKKICSYCTKITLIHKMRTFFSSMNKFPIL